jgi:uncharacterized peroxidase-related enzyme
MPHIELSPSLPGISAAFAFRPETAVPLRELAHILLFESGRTTSLSSRDRELIAAYVSSLNTCHFCQQSHGAAAAHHPGGSDELVNAVCANPRTADISPKLRALLAIAARVQADAKTVTPFLIEAARAEGATDLEIHDTVLIAGLSACTTDMWMAWPPGNPARPQCMHRWESILPTRVIEPPPRRRMARDDRSAAVRRWN